MLVFLPQVPGILNVLLLATLGTAAKQDNKRVSVSPKVDPVACPKCMRYSNAPPPMPFTLDRFPASIRARAVLILLAAIESKPSNQRPNGLRPTWSMYCLISNIVTLLLPHGKPWFEIAILRGRYRFLATSFEIVENSRLFLFSG